MKNATTPLPTAIPADLCQPYCITTAGTDGLILCNQIKPVKPCPVCKHDMGDVYTICFECGYIENPA